MIQSIETRRQSFLFDRLLRGRIFSQEIEDGAQRCQPQDNDPPLMERFHCRFESAADQNAHCTHAHPRLLKMRHHSRILSISFQMHARTKNVFPNSHSNTGQHVYAAPWCVKPVYR